METGRAEPARGFGRAGLLRLALLLVSLGLCGFVAAFLHGGRNDRARIESELTGLGRAAYPAQKVVYHVDYEAGWRGQAYEELTSALENHVRAVGADNLKLMVVLQGEGADFLARAKAKPAFAHRIDVLKEKGVRFLICRNTLIGRAIDPFTDLYGVAREDIVRSAVAELAALQQEGYVYLHL